MKKTAHRVSPSHTPADNSSGKTPNVEVSPNTPSDRTPHKSMIHTLSYHVFRSLLYFSIGYVGYIIYKTQDYILLGIYTGFVLLSFWSLSRLERALSDISKSVRLSLRLADSVQSIVDSTLKAYAKAALRRSPTDSSQPNAASHETSKKPSASNTSGTPNGTHSSQPSVKEPLPVSLVGNRPDASTSVPSEPFNAALMDTTIIFEPGPYTNEIDSYIIPNVASLVQFPGSSGKSLFQTGKSEKSLPQFPPELRHHKFNIRLLQPPSGAQTPYRPIVNYEKIHTATRDLRLPINFISLN